MFHKYQSIKDLFWVFGPFITSRIWGLLTMDPKYVNQVNICSFLKIPDPDNVNQINICPFLKIPDPKYVYWLFLTPNMLQAWLCEFNI